MFEQFKEITRDPIHAKSTFHANTYHQGHFWNSYNPSYSCVPLLLCDYCESSYHNICDCPYHDYVDVTCTSVEKTINDMTDKMVETM